MTNRWEHLARRIVLATAITTGLLLVLGMVLSYAGLRSAYLGAGFPARAAAAAPLCVDLLTLVGYVGLLVLRAKLYPSVVVGFGVVASAGAQGYHLSHGGVDAKITDGRVIFLLGASCMVFAGLAGHLLWKILERALPAGFITAMQDQPQAQATGWNLREPVAALAQQMADDGYKVSSTPWRPRARVHRPASNHRGEPDLDQPPESFNDRLDRIEQEARDRQAAAKAKPPNVGLPGDPGPLWLPGELDGVLANDPNADDEKDDLEPDTTERDELATVTTIPSRKTVGADSDRPRTITAKTGGKSQETGPCDPRCQKHRGIDVGKSTRYRCRARLDLAAARS